jgi:hypothetical protein
MSLILLRRLHKAGARIDKDNIITYLSVCIMLSFKLTEDDIYNIFSKIFRISNNKLCESESEVCNFLRFKLYIGAEEYNEMVSELLQYSVRQSRKRSFEGL